jgi:hypothetical protein
MRHNALGISFEEKERQRRPSRGYGRKAQMQRDAEENAKWKYQQKYMREKKSCWSAREVSG